MDTRTDAAIDTVIFDIGRVLVQYDPRVLYDQLLPTPEAVTTFLKTVCTSTWNFQQDLGRSWDEAIAELVSLHPDKAPLIRAFRERWQEMVPGAIDGSVEILETLHGNGVPLYAITNFASDTFVETRERFDFLNRFRDVVVSAEERCAKPDPRIYDIAINRFGIDPKQAIFIDDVEKNVVAARSTGLNAVQFFTPEQLRRDLAAVGLLPGS